MQRIQIDTKKGLRSEIAYNVNDFPYDELANHDEIVSKKGKKQTIEYINVAAAFDIESTTIETEKDSNGKYITSPFAFMYHWQLCIKDKVVFGRTWEEFQTFLKCVRFHMDLSLEKRLVIYVHSLPYEFQFMKEFISIESLFAKDKKKPLKVVTTDGFEFRCSYTLSNRSLASFCENENAIYYKQTNVAYNYSKIRTPNTRLTNDELSYCYCDVRGLCECIESLMKEDDLANIPMTNTGYVRRAYRAVMTKHFNEFTRKGRLTVEQYEMCKRAFRGGNTHANRFYANMILHDVFSFDISSSYPSDIAMGDYPIGKFQKVTIDSMEKLRYYMTKYCMVMDIEFFDIKLKGNTPIPYIDIAHCFKQAKIVNDNGRVLTADYIRMTITNVDLEIIMNTYDVDEFIVTNAIYAEKGKLPKELREKMMEFYYKKTTLKGIDGLEYDYMKSKNMLNATFGMMVTDLVHDETIYDQDTMKWDINTANIEEAIDKFYKNRNNFLWYQWGIFVTANSRKRLQDMIDVVGDDIVYIDTDSIKFLDRKHIAEFEELNKKLIKKAEENDVVAYVDYKGKRYHLGTWDNETKHLVHGCYRRFKTLGAKKYCYDELSRYKHTKKFKKARFNFTRWNYIFLGKGNKITKFHITVSGMGKVKGAKKVGKMENFKIGKRYTDIGRTTSFFNDMPIHRLQINGCEFTTASNIGIVESTYTFGVTKEYWELIYQDDYTNVA